MILKWSIINAKFSVNKHQVVKKKKIDKVDNLKAQALLESIEYDF